MGTVSTNKDLRSTLWECVDCHRSMAVESNVLMRGNLYEIRRPAGSPGLLCPDIPGRGAVLPGTDGARWRLEDRLWLQEMGARLIIMHWHRLDDQPEPPPVRTVRSAAAPRPSRMVTL